jgi:hypothetical protein
MQNQENNNYYQNVDKKKRFTPLVMIIFFMWQESFWWIKSVGSAWHKDIVYLQFTELDSKRYDLFIS